MLEAAKGVAADATAWAAAAATDAAEVTAEAGTGVTTVGLTWALLDVATEGIPDAPGC